MLIERSMSRQFLSNAYLVTDGEAGALLVDAGGPAAPLIEAAERFGVEPSHLLLTHHHHDHVSEMGALRERWPSLQVLAHPLERALIADGDRDAIATIEPGEELAVGALTVHALHTPGHTAGMLSFLLGTPAQLAAARGQAADAGAAPGGGAEEPAAIFTGDTLFRGSVGGVHAPGHTTFADLKSSIMDALMGLAPQTAIHPGHTDPTTVGEEWEHNPFIRIWRGLETEGAAPCTALGHSATLVLMCTDYDGGGKAWVRWPDGSDDIVPGSQVQQG